MAFESLSDKLQNVFSTLRGKGRLTEEDVKLALKQVKLALLEADVNFRIVKSFVKDVEEKCMGADVLESLTPAQTVVKIVNDELVKLMGGEKAELMLKPAGQVTVIMLAGLQGAGKTTTAAKLGGLYKSKGRNVLLCGADVYRPAAVDQLKVNADKLKLAMFEMGTDHKPSYIASEAYKYAKANGYNLLIIETAGRLHIDEAMMEELSDIKAHVDVDYTLLVTDAMTGQDAVNVAKAFTEKAGIDGVILTKLDGDTRGGAALSIREVTGVPIYFAGMSEKLDGLQEFYPERMASRILGMGDILSLIEKAQATADLEKQKAMEQRLRKAEFTYEDFLENIRQMKRMGGIGNMMSMLPGMKGLDADNVDEKQFDRIEAIILSMTPKERLNPKLMNPKRKQRIARGSGSDIAEVNRLVKQFEQMQKMMKQMKGMSKHGGLSQLGRKLGLKF